MSAILPGALIALALLARADPFGPVVISIAIPMLLVALLQASPRSRASGRSIAMTTGG
jgi:hypothetical protein